eukprot:TRINITY_DN11903_c0_g1_i1.p1 TRINITY_DN11903_c0_g1~~TRINITY_DN11903_c0_g1_i1.p1  ORF type:complete len:444 (+),score=112.29 TRINITY_DN11903_c0_g1_i1:62-1393(+)
MGGPTGQRRSRRAPARHRDPNDSLVVRDRPSDVRSHPMPRACSPLPPQLCIASPTQRTPSPQEAVDCPICGDEILLWGTWSNCGHSVCYICAIRLVLMKPRKMRHRCCLCKRTSKRVLIGTSRVQMEDVQKLETLPIRRRRLHVDCADKLSYERVGELLKATCNVCGLEAPSYAELANHTRRAHSLSHCDVCVAHRPLFMREQSLFTAKELSSHMSTERRDDSEVNHGHPICYLCCIYTYDSEALLNHVQNKHVMCGLCDHNGMEWVFFKDFAAFLQHCRLKHALCEACVSSGSYDTAIHDSVSDLKVHQLTCPKKHRYQLTPYKPPPQIKRQPTGLRLLMGNHGWTMERPPVWSRFRMKDVSKTVEWVAAQLQRDERVQTKGRACVGGSLRAKRTATGRVRSQHEATSSPSAPTASRSTVRSSTSSRVRGTGSRPSSLQTPM